MTIAAITYSQLKKKEYIVRETAVAWWGVLTALSHELLRPVITWAESTVGGVVVLGLSLAQLPSPAEGIYWLSGAYTYLVPTVLSIGLLAILLRRQALATDTWGKTLAAGLLIIAIMGGNEVNGLLLLTGLLAASVLAPGARLWFLVLVAAVAGAVAWGAPGNFVRLHYLNQQLALPQVVLRSVGAAGYCLLTWLGSGVLPLAALLLVAWVQQRVQRADGSAPLPLTILTRRPLLLSALLLGLLVVSFMPSYWTGGQPIPRRARNAVYALFVVGWLLTSYGWATWYWQRYPAPARWPRALVVAAIGWLALALLTDHNITLRHDQIGASANSLVQAYRDWLGGGAARYDQQQRARYRLLETTVPTSTPLRLDPLRSMPPTLFYFDITLNEQAWSNKSYAQYFGWPAVYVGQPARASY